MSDSRAVTLYEMSDKVRHWEIAYGAQATARLYVETFTDGRGRPGCTCRLHFDSEIDEAGLAEVVDAVRSGVLDHLPKGLCMIYSGRLRLTLEMGSERALQ